MPHPSLPSAPKKKLRHRDAPQVRLAALLTAHPPLRTVELAPDPELDLRTKLEFEPVGAAGDPGTGGRVSAPISGVSHPADPTKACFGLLHSNFVPRGLAFGQLPVKRGRWGSKPPEMLQLLQPMSEELLTLPIVRLRGTVRAAGEALTDVLHAGAARPALVGMRTSRATDAIVAGPGPPTTTQLWLAAELALQGYVPTPTLRHFASERGEAYPLPGVRVQPAGKRDMFAALIEQDGLLLWRTWLVRQTTRLAMLLKQAKGRNPFRTELAPRLAAGLLQLAEPATAGAILDQLAHTYNLKTRPSAPATLLLAGELAPPAPAADDAQAARAILGLFEADGTGPVLKDVRARYLSQLHVIAWLLEAGVIAELHGGMLITAARLDRCLNAYPVRSGEPGPSVRELKDKLGFGRREAEALRVWYLQRGAK